MLTFSGDLVAVKSNVGKEHFTKIKPLLYNILRVEFFVGERGRTLLNSS